MNKETKPQVFIHGAGNSGLSAALQVLMSRSVGLQVVASIESAIENIDISNEPICPVDIPDIFKIMKKQRQDAQHWRGGTTKKGGKVGYERR